MCPSPVHDVGSTSPVSVPELGPRVAETHTGMVFLVGDKATKGQKPIVTDFLDFSTVGAAGACLQPVALNRRLAPESYLGVAHFTLPGCGAARAGHRDAPLSGRVATGNEGSAGVSPWAGIRNRGPAP